MKTLLAWISLAAILGLSAGQQASGDGDEDVFGECDCAGQSCPKRAADVAIVLDVTYSMQRYFGWVEQLVETIETWLIRRGMGSGKCQNLYSLTVFGLSGNASCGNTLSNMEDRYIIAKEFRDLISEMMVIRNRYGTSNCEDGWEAMVAALKTPRRSQLQDQSCVQLLTVLVTDEDRQPCCDAGNSQVSADCCNKSSSVDRRSLIRQLRRDGAEVAMVVDQEIHGNRHGSIKLLGIRETDAGRIGIDHSAGAAEGIREVAVRHIPIGYQNTRADYTKVPLKRQLNGTAWCLRCSEHRSSAMLQLMGAVLSRECAECSKIRGRPSEPVTPLTTTPMIPTTPSEVLCPAPPSTFLQNADIIIGPPSFPAPLSAARVLWRCASGYRPLRGLYQECQQSGESYVWLPVFTSNPCELISCSSLRPPENGLLIPGTPSFKPGEIARAPCLRGYQPVADTVYTCTGEGEWSGSDLGVGTAPSCAAWNETCTEIDPALPAGGEINLAPPSVAKNASHSASKACIIVTMPGTPEIVPGLDVAEWLRDNSLLSGVEERRLRGVFDSVQFCLVAVPKDTWFGCVRTIEEFQAFLGDRYSFYSQMHREESEYSDTFFTLSNEVSQRICSGKSEVRFDIIFHHEAKEDTVVPVEELLTEVQYRSSVVMVITDRDFTNTSGTPDNSISYQRGNKADSISATTLAEKIAFSTHGWVADVRRVSLAWIGTTIVNTLLELRTKICRRCWCGGMAPQLSCANLYMLNDDNCVFGRVGEAGR
ncbi:uncharacterized protein LOC135819182 isoform X2 [Sycon ciliatum]|uniref:uncharacterized protein LOC135819182 isoform X2 n=1 Tax=Sycon ciliatum TaxID=27933 RepID=UPI0031F6E899